jgi:hypothetical protein
MTNRTRRQVLAAGIVAATAIRSDIANAAPEMADFLFVQTSKGIVFDKGTSQLTLTGVSPVTLYFTDRPERVAGNMKTARFIPFWSEGADSFKANPPNADLSIIEGQALRQVVVELQNPVLKGEDLTYTVKIIAGDMPARADAVSVFIDIIGRPLTPFSFAGVARRNYRRAVLY